jgi:thiazole synthase
MYRSIVVTLFGSPRLDEIPLIVDAGIGLLSHTCQVMEWGFDGVLLNTAVSRANDLVQMASAFANAIRAGRGSFLAGPMSVQEIAVASTPEIGRPLTFDLPTLRTPHAREL